MQNLLKRKDLSSSSGDLWFIVLGIAKGINVFEIYGDDTQKITITIDPIFKKEYKLEFTYELGGIETPAAENNSGYADVVGVIDNSNSFDVLNLHC